MNIEISPLGILDGQALSELAYERIRDQIVRVEIPPGAPLPEDRLSEEFGLGLTPIRNALRRLSTEHLVMIYPRRGTFTAEINIGDERWLTEFRTEVEGLAAYLAAERASSEERQELLRLANSFRIAKKDREVSDLDAHFHRQMFTAARNPFLQASASVYYNLSLRIWYYCSRNFTVSETRGTDHMALAQAISEHNPEGARAAARDHILSSSRVIRGLLAHGTFAPI